MKDKIILSESDTLPVFVASETVLYAPGRVHPRRVFPIFDLILVHEGDLFLREEGKIYRITAGTWFIQTPGSEHEGVYPQKTAVKFTFVHFRLNGNYRIAEETGEGAPFLKTLPDNYIDAPPLRLRIPMSGSADGASLGIAGELAACFGAGGSPARCQSLFLDLFSRLLEPENIRKDRGGIAAFIEDRFLEPDFSLAWTAGQLGYSRQYITRLLRRETGRNFSAFVADLKLRYARSLLAEENIPPGEIARQLGYADEAAFSHMFKKRTGFSPSAFRKAFRK